MKKITSQWMPKPSLATPRSHGATAVVKGKIYVFGGGGPNFESLKTVEIFDPETNTWGKGKDMPTRRSGAVAIARENKIYVIGGGFKKPDGCFQFLPTVEIYDPEKNDWSLGPDMLMPHDYPGGILFQDAIYILGGHHPDAVVGGPRTDPGFDFCERLDFTRNRWEQIASLPTPRFALAAIGLEKIFALGGVAFTKQGFNNYDIVEIYDHADNSWHKANDLSLPWPAAALGACEFQGKILVFGGYSKDSIHNRDAIYDPSTTAWEDLPPMLEPRAAMGVAIIDQTIYLVGGWTDDGRTPIGTVESLTIK